MKICLDFLNCHQVEEWVSVLSIVTNGSELGLAGRRRGPAHYCAVPGELTGEMTPALGSNDGASRGASLSSQSHARVWMPLAGKRAGAQTRDSVPGTLPICVLAEQKQAWIQLFPFSALSRRKADKGDIGNPHLSKPPAPHSAQLNTFFWPLGHSLAHYWLLGWPIWASASWGESQKWR